MGVRERKVEKYLDDRMTRIGGLTRKWVSPGRNGVPDRICMHHGKIWFVEVKTEDGLLSPPQVREHDRLSNVGVKVHTVYGRKGVDEFMTGVLNHDKISKSD